MKKLELIKVRRSYGDQVALKEFNLSVDSGEFVTLLGPSGSGKSTLLKLVAGIIQPSEGSVVIDGRDITQVDPRKRDLGMVFQNYALIPHMSVFENVAFPLRVRREAEAALKARVEGALAKVRMTHLSARLPAELSGGQQQRVAIARAIVYNPSLVLMDEPLGALDKKLREQLQAEIKALHRELGITVLYVTHDQTEAMAMSDRVILMNNGAAEQIDTPRGLYQRPRSRFSADFLGDSNFFKGTVSAAPHPAFSFDGLACQFSMAASPSEAGGPATLLVRPECIRFSRQPPDAGFSVPATYVDQTFLGGSVGYLFRLANGETVKVTRLNDGDDADPQAGTEYTLSWRTDSPVFVQA